jgi:F-type H+-transporting ATPase subunit b
MRRLVLAISFALVLAAPAASLAQDIVEEGDAAHDPTEGTHAEDHASAHDEHDVDRWAIAAGFINFAILIWILVKMGRKPLASFLVDRRATIEQEIAEASRLKKEAQAKHAEYEARLKALDKEIASLRQEMVDAGVAERDRIIADAQSKAERMRKDTQFVIDQQLKQLRIDLTRETVSAAVAAAGQELQKSTTSDDQQRLAREYLNRLGKGGQA